MGNSRPVSFGHIRVLPGHRGGFEAKRSPEVRIWPETVMDDACK
jgi:hypothetical protein